MDLVNFTVTLYVGKFIFSVSIADHKEIRFLNNIVDNFDLVFLMDREDCMDFRCIIVI